MHLLNINNLDVFTHFLSLSCMMNKIINFSLFFYTNVEWYRFHKNIEQQNCF